MTAWDRWIAECTHGLLGYCDRVIASLDGKCALTYAANRMDACQVGLCMFPEEKTLAKSMTYVKLGNPRGLLH